MPTDQSSIGTAGVVDAALPMSAAHRIALALVWLTMASGAVVFTEPAPFDVFALGLLALLPVLGLVRATPALLGYVAITLVPVACAFFAILIAIDPQRAIVHTCVTLFLTLVSLMLTAFVIKSPARHSRLICNGATAAALVAATAGMAGYLNVFPGAYDLFTLYGRVSGTFKDPNVFGASLVMPAIYLISVLLMPGRWRRKIPTAAGLLVLVLGVLLSFSRAAWFSLAVSTAVFAYLSFVTASGPIQRLRVVAGIVGACVAGAILVMVALQFDTVSELLTERASLAQSYDEGPEGRFGGQEKAEALILTHPLGLGAQQFDGFYHLEEAHNVYLSMYMNAGWLGGTLFALMIAVTVVLGMRHAFRRTKTQTIFVVVYAALVAHAIEGFVIDLDHWRHFHMLMALTWGLMLGDRAGLMSAYARQALSTRAARSFSLVPSTTGHIAS